MGITIRDVAQAAGVSTATVSRALRGLPNVDEQTRRSAQATSCTEAQTPGRWCACHRGTAERTGTPRGDRPRNADQSHRGLVGGCAKRDDRRRSCRPHCDPAPRQSRPPAHRHYRGVSDELPVHSGSGSSARFSRGHVRGGPRGRSASRDNRTLHGRRRRAGDDVAPHPT